MLRGHRATGPLGPLSLSHLALVARQCREATLMKRDSAPAPVLPGQESARCVSSTDAVASSQRLFKALLGRVSASKQHNYVSQTSEDREHEDKMCSTHPEDEIKEKQHVFDAFCAARHSHGARCASVSSLSCPGLVLCRGSHSSWQRSRFVLQKPLLYNQE